ncbi:LysR family transcriptional regulator [Kangiella shandongensis]|uniref:LysR family transcriptional regulator n=1 Tax=Kangiella shandongensis TaxID=2763258 RepID=UPI001CC04740|nr:LysR family transcriptional regulator [Kangiella shandongensis]
MDRIDALKLFALVAETESFTKAAEISNNPRSTVSAVVKQIEGKYGVRLLYRTTRQVTLTHEGKVLLERSQQLIDEMEETENIFRLHNHNISGKLKVDVPSRIGARIIAPKLSGFFELYPNIQLELGASDRAVDLVYEAIDCAIRVGDLNSSSLIARPLGTFKIINCASPDYLRNYGKPQSLEDLHHHRIVSYSSPISGDTSPFEYVNDKGDDSEFEIQSSMTVNHAETYIASAIAGLGIIQIPAFDVQDHIANQQLQEVLPDYRPRPMPVNAVYPHRRHLSQRVRVFIEWFTSVIEDKVS